MLKQIVTAAGGALLALLVIAAMKWDIWDRFIQPEPMSIPVVLSTQLNFDDTGVYTGEIRRALEKRALEKAKFNYRIIDRAFPRQGTIVPSTVRLENVRNEAERMLDVHGGDVLIYGAVGAKPNIISIKCFGRAPDGYIERGIEIDIDDETWSNKVIRAVEEIATESSLEQLLGKRRFEHRVRPGMSLEEFEDALERKLSALNEGTDSEFLKERTELGVEMVQTARAKGKNDITTIRRIRRATEERVGTTPRTGESHFHKVRRMGLADLYMFEGLMEGNAEKIDEGMKIAIDAGAAMLEDGMKGDETAVQRPENATFVHWLMMTILVLACDDQKAMKRLELLLFEHCVGTAGQECMTWSDALRMLLPLTVLNSNPNREQLEAFRAFLAESRDFGMQILDHWQDPFLHARRLAIKRLASMERLYTRKREPLVTSCPTLARWMEMKGWSASDTQVQPSRRSSHLPM